MRRLIIHVRCYWVVIVCVVSLAGCSGEQADSTPPTPTTEGQPILNIFGPAGSKEALATLQVAFETSELPYELRVYEGNATEPGIRGVLDGTFDLMILMRPPRPDEPLEFIEFITTPVAIFVNPGAGLDNLTREQAATVFSGEVINWSQLGGADQDIVLVVQEEDDTNTQAIHDHILQGKPFTEASHTIVSDRDVLTIVEGVPGAIGYGSWAGKKYYELVSSSEFLDAIALDGILPENPAYPIVSSVGIAYRSEQRDFLQPLFDWGLTLKEFKTIHLLSAQFGIWWVDFDTVGESQTD